MQAANTFQPKLRLSAIAVACHLACMGAAFAQDAAPVAAPAKNEVVITGKKLGMGLMVTEDAPKARSTITSEELEKQRPTGNAYQALEMLPAVNSYNQDATGLFGGGLTLRGFNSDQIGATINGVPVNDSGNFAVFPQEYVDQENVCSEFVTQGSTDVDSPQVGATGGNFGIKSCQPENVSRVRIMQTLGQLASSKTFVRYDTGLLSDQRSKMFISYSRADADKWKGLGKAQRDHIDIGANYDWDRFNYFHGTLLYNQAINNNINNVTLTELNTKGYYYDQSDTFVGHLTPVKGTAQVEAQALAYYKLSNNPFKNAIFSAESKFRLGADTDIKIVPYFWYGFGTGGIQSSAKKENAFYNAATKTNTATVDLNGDGDFLDTVIVANSGITRTKRPGVTASVTHTIGQHEILGGFWYERANHRQTGPSVAVNADGSPSDYWLQDNQIRRPDGSPVESRDNLTISTAFQVFIQDTMSFMDDRLKINLGVRNPHIKRDVTNYASEGNLFGTYNMTKTYKGYLPQLGARFRVTNDDQFFVSMAKNTKAPPNFVFTNTGSNVKLVNGVPTLIGNVAQESSWNTDIGYRHQDSKFIATATIYFVDFKNRQATAFDPVTQASTYTNVGAVKNKGVEFEVGNTPIGGFAFYGSLGYSNSQLKDNIPVSATLFLPTAGRTMPLTPKFKAGLSAEYQKDAAWIRLTAKATSQQQATLVNDEQAPGYTVFGMDAGYTFANFGVLKRPKLNFNWSNLGNKQYRNPSSQSILNTTPFPGSAPGTLRYYLGAPRFASVTLSVDY
jgi:iron complex outermembrane receptor protein